MASQSFRRLLFLSPPLLVLIVMGVILVVSVRNRSRFNPAAPRPETVQDEKKVQQKTESEFVEQRRKMVSSQIEARGVSDQSVLTAMRKVPRHQFVPPDWQTYAYRDSPLSIGHQQTISQPYIVALMTQLARPNSKSKALDVGTGSGYQAAVLAEIVKNVYSIEIVEPLANTARKRLKKLGYENIEVRHGDGYQGWKEHAPFDVIIVAAAPDHIPQPLIDQLAPGGRLIIPVGDERRQDLLVLEKRPDGTIHRRKEVPVAFVPMTGEARKKK